MARDSMEKDVIKAFLGDETEFTGLLAFEGTVRIDGKFDGEIKTNDNLIIGQPALIRATISVGSIMVLGRVEGDISATKKIHITSKGQVIGNVFTPALHIEDGAVLEGNVSMIKHEPDGNVLQLVRRKKSEGEDPRQSIPAASA
jgi:cytoskeletal protein CcmA (bactofilin family)